MTTDELRETYFRMVLFHIGTPKGQPAACEKRKQKARQLAEGLVNDDAAYESLLTISESRTIFCGASKDVRAMLLAVKAEKERRELGLECRTVNTTKKRRL